MPVCPHCNGEIAAVQADGLPIKAADRQFAGIAYSCPHIDCRKIIGMEFDPLRLSAITAQRIVKNADKGANGQPETFERARNGAPAQPLDVTALTRTAAEDQPMLI